MHTCTITRSIVGVDGDPGGFWLLRTFVLISHETGLRVRASIDSYFVIRTPYTIPHAVHLQPSWIHAR